MKKSPILELSPEDNKIIQGIVELFRTHQKDEGPMQGMLNMQHVSSHFLAQQLAYFSVGQRTPDERMKFLKMALNKLSVMVRYYEEQIKAAPRGKEKKPSGQ